MKNYIWLIIAFILFICFTVLETMQNQVKNKFQFGSNEDYLMEYTEAWYDVKESTSITVEQILQKIKEEKQ